MTSFWKKTYLLFSLWFQPFALVASNFAPIYPLFSAFAFIRHLDARVLIWVCFFLLAAVLRFEGSFTSWLTNTVLYIVGPVYFFSLCQIRPEEVGKNLPKYFMAVLILVSIFQALILPSGVRGVPGFFSEPSYASRAFVMAGMIYFYLTKKLIPLLFGAALLFAVNKSATLLVLILPILVMYIWSLKGNFVVRSYVFAAVIGGVYYIYQSGMYENVRGLLLVYQVISSSDMSLQDYIMLGGRRAIQTFAAYYLVFTHYPFGVGPESLNDLLQLAQDTGWTIPNTKQIVEHWSEAKPTSWFGGVFLMFGFPCLVVLIALLPILRFRGLICIWSSFVFLFTFLLVSNPLDPTPWVALWVNMSSSRGGYG